MQEDDIPVELAKAHKRLAEARMLYGDDHIEVAIAFELLGSVMEQLPERALESEQLIARAKAIRLKVGKRAAMLKRQYGMPVATAPALSMERLTGKQQLIAITVTGGDIRSGVWGFEGNCMRLPFTDGSSCVIDLLGVKVRKLGDRTVKDQRSSNLSALGGAFVLGPIGAAAGYALGGTTTEISAQCMCASGATRG